jgi:DNA-binding SARP family transcriptional activator
MDEYERQAIAEEDEIERKLRLGRHMELVPDVVDAVEAEPVRERRSLQLMLALYRCGRQASALAEFQRCRNALYEVGLEPSVEAVELDRAIALERPWLDWTGADSIAY